MRNLYNKILVYHQAAIGDMVMAISAMQAIRANFPNSQIDLLAISSVKGSIQRSLIEPLNIFNNTFFIEHFGSSLKRLPPKIKITKKILSARYDTVFMLSYGPKWYEYMLFQLSHIKNIISLSDWSCGQVNRCYCDVFLDKLEYYGLKTKKFRGIPNLHLSDTEIENGNIFYNSLDIPQGSIPILCCITAGKRSSLYSYEKYKNIILKIKKEYNIYPVFICSEEEISSVNLFIESLKPSCEAGILTSKGNLRELVCAIKNFRFYLGNDTGSIHLAALAGLRCIGVYSSSTLGKSFYPIGEGHIIIQNHILECCGCYRDVCPYGEVSPCIDLISEDDVVDKVREMILTCC